MDQHDNDGALGWLREKLSVGDFQKAASEHNAIVVRIRSELLAQVNGLRVLLARAVEALETVHRGIEHDHIRDRILCGTEICCAAQVIEKELAAASSPDLAGVAERARRSPQDAKGKEAE